ncbi:LOW QUALITY PROTEIN: serine protease 44-like [Rhagoletis pomonella]|uniref:LOW QUALITY PROTEIN: serine protease 44-like n=1 Tax=Rhagoletis pomonella TaxID=28610 RepID=UPI00177E3711|nr:LOW QUALITY PROTEIN: serine protease 44-like [Rhagoletis pomonella]
MIWSSDLCYKLYFWPFLNYLAGIKGICPYFIGYFPFITLAPGTILTSPSTASTTTSTTTSTTITTTTVATTIPTFPTFSPTPPTVTTQQPCPAQPLACLNGGVPPIAYCPCIDPRLSGLAGGTGTTAAALLTRFGQASQTQLQSAGQLTDRLTFAPINTQPNGGAESLQPKASGSSLSNSFFNLPFGVQNGAQSPGPVGSEVMVFSSLRRRRRRRNPAKSMPFKPVATQQQSGPNTLTFKFSSLNSNAGIQTSPQINPTSTPSQLVTPALIPPTSVLIPSSTITTGILPANSNRPVVVLPPSIPNNVNSTVVNIPTRLPSLRGQQSCGLTSAYTNKVVGGSEASRGAYPWLVALGYRDEYKPDALKFLCGGSLISSRYVLTSGHCINALLSTVRVGAHDLSNANEEGAINISVERKIVHEQYNERYVVNDIGLVKLRAAAPNTAYIGPICLPDGERFEQNFVGMNPFVAGWGAVKFQGPSSNVLRDVQVPIVNQQSCEQSYNSVFQHIAFTDRFICAGNSYVDACQGEFGGPLRFPMLENGAYHYYILGLVSYGYECARAGFPGVYTRVASYLPWIRSHMT